MYKYYYIAMMSFREKNRNFSFLIMIYAAVFITYFFIPGNSPLQIIMIEPSIFIQGGNPSWIPLTSSWGLGFFLPLVGFFYLKGVLYLDYKLGIQQLISTTGATEFEYVLGKFISYSMILMKIVFYVILSSFIIMKILYPIEPLDMYTFFSPYIYLIPATMLIAAFVVLFDSIYLLRGSLGSIVYIVLYIIIFGFSMNTEMNRLNNIPEIVRLFDYTGSSILFRQVINDVLEQSGQPLNNLLFLAYQSKQNPSNQLLFSGVNFVSKDIIILIGMGLIAIILVYISSRFLSIKKHKIEKYLTSSLENSISNYVPYKYYEINKQISILSRVSCEIKLMLLGLPKSWWILVTLWFVFCIFTPLEMAQIMIPATIIILIKVLAYSGCREYVYETISIIIISQKGIVFHMVVKWLSNFLILNVFASPILIKMILSGQYQGIYVCLAGFVFLSSGAIFLGEYTKKENMFEVCFLIWTYLAINGVDISMYLSIHPQYLSSTRATIYLILGVFLFLNILIKRIIKNYWGG